MDIDYQFSPKLRDAMASGNVALVLSLLSGKPALDMEAVLQTGKNPWQAAKELGILNTFQDLVLTQTLYRVAHMVNTGQMSRQQADAMLAGLELSPSTPRA